MAFNGSGVFARIYNFVADRNNGIKIRADRMDTELDGIASGLSNCITKDGQTTVTGNIPFNDKRLTQVGDASASTDAVNLRTGDGRYLERDGTGSMSGPFLAADGTVSAPGMSFSSDTNSGFYRIGADNIGAAVNGTKILDIDTAGVDVTGTIAATAGVSGTTGTFSSAISGTTGTFTGAITMQSRDVDAFPAGTKMLFQQTAAPTGWTKDTTHNNKALRVVSGTASSGGSTAFTTVFAARTIAQANLPNIAPTITITDPGHNHEVYRSQTSGFAQAGSTAGVAGTAALGRFTEDATTGITATATSINGNVTQTAMDFAVQYVDIVICTKD